MGYLFPSFAHAARLISETFINMIRMVIAPVIFFTIVSGIAGADNLKNAGRIGGKALIYFEIVTTAALVIGLVVANVVKPGAGINYSNNASDKVAQYATQAKDMNWGEFFAHIVPSNIVDSFAKGDYLSLSIIFLAQVFSVDLSLGQELSIIAILLITGKGAAGVTGSGFIVLASTLTAIKVIPLEGLALLIGVDRFMSEGRSIINFIGNAVATVVIAKSEHAIDESVYERVVVQGQPTEHP